ncbi:hypothetical protein JW926_07595, partial [Candidatus Sumerlaeota bacterium]|nr:hypothetical protein [Candidatus Sumerlaeota bacterium]
KAMFKKDDLAILPIEPETQRLLKMSKFRGGDYYGLTAGILLEHDFLDADSAPASAIVNMLEKRKGLILGVCEFMEGIDHAYTYGYLLNRLKRDEVKKVLLGFWGMLAHGMTRDTYSPVEVTMIATGENHLTLPHLYSCTQQLTLLRNMLLREDGDTLWIAQAAPRSWFEPGKIISVKDAPTLFGALSYEIRSSSAESVIVHLEPPSQRIPKEIRIRLRHPVQFEIQGVLTKPSVDVEFSGETIVLKNLDRAVDLWITLGAR